MTYDKGTFAFFDGSSPEYKKVIGPGQTVAGLKIGQIEPDSVRLTSTSTNFELNVGTQLRRQGTEWRVVAETVRTKSTGFGSSGETASAKSEEGDADVVKRLMRQREEEMK